MPDPMLTRILEMLDAAGVEYRHIEHEPTYTSEQSAQARGEDIRIGGKALLVKAGDAFRLFVLSARLKLDNAAIRQRLNERKTRFATAEELMKLTGLVPGSVPPFGRPILPFDLYIDTSIIANQRIAFNAGSLTHSVIMPVPDYLRLADPEIFPFALPWGV